MELDVQEEERPVRTSQKPTRKLVPKNSTKSLKSQKPPLYVADRKDLDRLHKENEKLIFQLLDFTEQMDTRIQTLHEREPHQTIEDHIALHNDPELRDMMEKLGSKGKKIKGLQQAINEMYIRLESSYKIDRIVEMENRLTDCHRINNELQHTIDDLK